MNMIDEGGCVMGVVVACWGGDSIIKAVELEELEEIVLQWYRVSVFMLMSPAKVRDEVGWAVRILLMMSCSGGKKIFVGMDGRLYVTMMVCIGLFFWLLL